MSDIVKKDQASIDNFAGWDDGVEGDDRPQGAGIIQGALIKFSNQATWMTRDGDELPADFELVAVDINRVVQKWHDQQPVETIILEPHQKFPDIKEMNEETPREEWVEGPDGQPRGPWQSQHILYLLNLASMDRFSFATGTTGGGIAIRELRDKLMWMRRLRGPNVYPVVVLSDTFFPTRFGGRQRPHFKIVRWVSLGSESGEVEALPPPPTTPPAQQTPAQSELPLVQEPSLQEDLNDSIPDFENENAESPKTAAPPLPTPRRNIEKPAKPGAKKPPPKRNVLDAG